MTEVKVTTHSETHFDPEQYIETIYSNFTGDKPDDKFIKFILDSLHDVFKDGQISGERLLDIGTGPVCHGIYPASRWFKEIVLSDLSESNLEVLREWKAGNVVHQEAVFKYMMGLEGNKEDWVKCNQQLSQKVSAIIHSDLHKQNPLTDTPLENTKFDAITLQLCQNAASPTEEQYKQCVINYSNLLKPGGHIIVVDILGEDFYTIGKHKFKVLHATEKMIKNIYTEAGYNIVKWIKAKPDQFMDYPPFVLVASKR